MSNPHVIHSKFDLVSNDFFGLMLSLQSRIRKMELSTDILALETLNNNIKTTFIHISTSPTKTTKL